MTRTLRVSRRRIVPMLVATIGFSTSATAVLQDSTPEMRAGTILQKLGWVEHQSRIIDDSSVPLARDLRVLVRERLVLGGGDDYPIARYRNFVLLIPPLQLKTVALWIGPALLDLIDAIGFGHHMRRRSDGECQQPLMYLRAIEPQQLRDVVSERRPA